MRSHVAIIYFRSLIDFCLAHVLMAATSITQDKADPDKPIYSDQDMLERSSPWRCEFGQTVEDIWGPLLRRIQCIWTYRWKDHIILSSYKRETDCGGFWRPLLEVGLHR